MYHICKYLHTIYKLKVICDSFTRLFDDEYYRPIRNAIHFKDHVLKLFLTARNCKAS